jgi:hypothetical protein
MAKLKMGAITDGADKNQYCGPSAISAVTNLTTGEAARLIRKQSGRRSVKGTYDREIREALRACNIKVRRRWWPGQIKLDDQGRSIRPTLAAWLKMSKEDRTPGQVFLVCAGNHWQLVSGRRYTCGMIREIVSIKDKRVKRRARVRVVYELTSDHVTRPGLDVSKPKDPNASARAKAHRIANTIGAEIEVYRDGTFTSVSVYPPADLFEKDEDDPCDGEHIADDWEEALSMVLDYEKIALERSKGL